MVDDLRRPRGWTLIATLRHQPGRPTSIQLADAGARIDTNAWSRSEGWCEHCRTRRARRTTYLLRDRDGGLVQVGSNCLSELIGHAEPLSVLRSGLGVRSPHTAHHQTDGGAPVEYIETLGYLAHVAQAVLDLGFVSTAAASRTTPATWSQALVAFDHGRAPSRRARRRAHDALDWVRSELATQGPLHDCDRRLEHVLGQQRLTLRELPTAAAGIYAYHQHLRREIAARKRIVK